MDLMTKKIQTHLRFYNTENIKITDLQREMPTRLRITKKDVNALIKELELKGLVKRNGIYVRVYKR